MTDGVLISTKEGRYLTATTEDATYGWRYVQTLPYANVLNKTHNTNRRLWAGMIIVVVILLFIWFNTIYTQNASDCKAAENIRLKTQHPARGSRGLPDLSGPCQHPGTGPQPQPTTRCCTASAMYCRNTSCFRSSAENRCTAKKRRLAVN